VDDERILTRLSELGEELPEPPQALAAYVPVVVSGSSAFVSGQVPTVDGEHLHPGVLGESVTVAEGAAGARRAALQALAALRGELGSFGPLRRIVKLTVYVAASPGFVDHPEVANGASEFLMDVLGEPGGHARAAVGMSSLPRGASVEVEVLAEIEPPPGLAPREP
jgi:enamine deaminase RidA (YjgF/YER057c/UK114 family)